MNNSTSRTRRRKDFVIRYEPAISRIVSMKPGDPRRVKLKEHLVENAREQLGYSSNTKDHDIWSSLNATLKRLRDRGKA